MTDTDTLVARDPGTLTGLLRDPATIRRRCRQITAAVDAGHSAHFRIDRRQLPAVAQRIAQLTRQHFPDLQIPYHSRWRHFEAGGVDRKDELDTLLAGAGTAELARARIDLTLVSVLLDAGAGAGWTCHEEASGRSFGRSEGLAVATFRAFLGGAFSSDPERPCQVDARGLLTLDAGTLAAIFQVSDLNPLVGLDGRVALMHGLGQALAAQPARFGADGRPGRMFDRLSARAAARDPAVPTLPARELLAELLDAFSTIWPSGQWIDGEALGDVWPHPHAGAADEVAAGWVPFHKLSQWLSYSLLEPFEWSGIAVAGLDELTGLPEYRNGGLLLDAGVLVPLRPEVMSRPLSPADPWVIEWRALTITLLDELAPRVRAELGASAEALPLACMLEGGSWAAGRQIAAERRPGGAPPVQIDSDGTVF
ncbi:uncharacterized protein DUF1688 [Sphaerotilus hippei]|uniref:Uncharacterized protein DUF1688 n=1 Tax=Sphaerotilus hippei TaxID=744406 RepID=A0A318GUP0_9BURK|nr:URC4/urg3 family protein [Sphaerotilus hippei]PXW92764.1 uncharacterized protein DUF1688 [Sphaerotilus hippei]